MRSRKNWSLAALLVMVGSILALAFPVQVSALSYQAAFVDKHEISLTSFVLTEADKDSDWFNDDLSDINIDSLNLYISDQLLGSYIDVDIEDNDEGYVRTVQNCTSNITLANTDSVYKIREARIVIPGLGCRDITGGEELALSDLNRTNENVWFRWNASNSMERVDGVGGNWVNQDPNELRRFFRSDESGTDHQDYINVPGDTSGTLYIRNNNADDDAPREVGITGVVNRANPPVEANPTPVPGAESGDSCESHGAMAWLLCPVVTMIGGTLNWLDSQIQALLQVNEEVYTNSNMQRAWANIRNIAYILLIPTMLIMVLGTALGFEIFSAYTVKRALPRMVAAVIFITLSWYICGFMIGFFNVVGSGILGLMTAPFPGAGDMTLDNLFAPGIGGTGAQWVTTLGALAALGGFIALTQGAGLMILLLYLGSAALFLAAAFLVLVLRQMFIIALLLLAPLAILAWIFPGNDKPWKLWWGTFTKLLIMFPLIMAIIAAGRIFAYIIRDTDGGDINGSIVAPVLEIMLRLAAMAAVAFVIYGGFRYITSQGEPDSAKAARQTIMNAVIGLMIALLSTAIVSFVARSLTS